MNVDGHRWRDGAIERRREGRRDHVGSRYNDGERDDMDGAQDEFVRLIRLDQLPLDQGVFVAVGSRELAVFRLSDPAGVYAIDNSCPHAGGNLSAGDLLKGGVIRCPWHAWKFRLCDGRSADGSVSWVNSYPIEIRGEEVYVKLVPRFNFEFEE